MRIEPRRVVRAALTCAANLVFGVSFAADEIHWTITGPTSVTFDWRGSASESSISYGLAAGSYAATQTAASPTGTCVPFSSAGPFWEAKLTGLSADTLYHYSIAGGPGHTFRTPPPSGPSSFEILVEGDIGDGGAYSLMPIVQQLMAEELDARFALMVGDLTYANVNGQSHVDQHFNDVMVWSRDVAYMPAWGNHEWDTEATDDLRNYKGRFDFVNARSASGTPAVSDCGEDWYWFDYGNARFIAYPEPFDGAWADWNDQAAVLMNAAQADPDIAWIVTFGHRPAYSTGNHLGSGTLKGYLDALAATRTKYVLNLNGHSHNYERTFPQDGSGDNSKGAIHLTVGTGGGTLDPTGEPCPWFICEQPSWSAARYFHLGYLKLAFSPTSITGSFVCGPSSLADDVTCTQGSILDSFVIDRACVDADEDGYGDPGSSACSGGAAGDCDDASAAIHPGAPEINDGADNQCPGHSGYGLIDESSGTSGFNSPADAKTELSWPSQPNATGWEVARAVSPDFLQGCGTVATSVPRFTDEQTPESGQVFYYLNRPVSPFVGSWGAHGSGVEWGVLCPTTGTSTLTASVTAASDDAEETSDGSMRLLSSDLDLTLDGSNQTVGMRFNGLTIPHGARILNAYVQFAVRDATSAPTSVEIKGQDDDNPPTFTATHGDLSGRSRTAAFASWSPPAWSAAAGKDQRTSNLAAIVREIVSRPGWVGGNSLVIIITGTGDRSAKSWDYDAVNHLGSPRLHVDFDDGVP